MNRWYPAVAHSLAVLVVQMGRLDFGGRVSAVQFWRLVHLVAIEVVMAVVQGLVPAAVLWGWVVGLPGWVLVLQEFQLGWRVLVVWPRLALGVQLLTTACHI